MTTTELRGLTSARSTECLAICARQEHTCVNRRHSECNLAFCKDSRL